MATAMEDPSEAPIAVAFNPEAAGYRGRSTVTADVVDQPVPVTIISGFLGAGKTTLVNQIVTEEHGFRVAVILNEFGDETGIEKAVLQDEDNAAFALQEIIELANGCLCCSVKDDLVQALETLVQQRSRFDYLLIETSGLADPGPVAAALWTDEALQSSVCLDAIVTVVDGRNISHQLAQRPSDGAVNEAQQQIAYADVVLLNKMDLVPDPVARRELHASISALNATAEVYETTRCHLHLEHLLGRGILHNPPSSDGSFPAPGDVGRASGTVEEPAPLAKSSGPFKAGSLGAKEALEARGYADSLAPMHHHDSDVGSVTLHAGAVELEKLKRWLDELLWEDNAAKRDIYRMKGGISIVGSDSQHVLQAVRDLYEVKPGPVWPEEAERLTKLVVVGRGLNLAALQQGLTSCA